MDIPVHISVIDFESRPDMGVTWSSNSRVYI